MAVRRAQLRVVPDPVEDASVEPEPDADPEAVARAICLKMLSARACSKNELAKALSWRQVPAEVAEHVLGRFSEVGLIDDAAFAAAWVHNRRVGRGLARRALAHELRKRGIAEDEIREAVAQVSDDDELATARDLVAKRLRSMRGVTYEAQVRRLTGMLERKGYSGALAHRVVREMLGVPAEAY